MSELTVDPGPGIPDGLVIPAGELRERFARSSGPGGQGVNTTDSKVQLSFDVRASTTLTEAQRRRVLHRLRHRMADGVLAVEASEERSQLRNRAAARQRLAAMLREALAPPPPKRRATRPTRGSVERRLRSKKHRAELKSARRRPGE
ncbi:aminoacyl-tRNA hydrolase [Tessaracoccus sp. MC1865]|uniref:alternative ribosome rescue aminoacyl-tRNA hydrolase ArfB n=1 Tax=Tessaracoccus sp. MC1865 TaxID=2760310 RepID=UPI0015FF08DE|nr:alternative ribosome rescue aminoacyl-tRNA hydrolase ArfB [Tessaracoccus sp. MC1865]MBB1483137.1 aminoacyl-tRNA hydrolase [Tessaracoccus sp. MC1865]QTO37435.1 aminoacyl-tRNA hydrolase [Tessaracoccus sp. MC1865]